MDTLSRDSSSSSNIMPLASLLVGGLALIFGIFALVKANNVQKKADAHETEIQRIASIESQVQSAATKSDSDIKNLRAGVQTALDQVGTEIGNLRGQITKVEEAMKKPAPAPARAGGAAAAPTGVLNSDGTYTIAAGDTLSKVARKFSVSLDALLAENPGIDPRSLRVGQKIRVPRR